MPPDIQDSLLYSLYRPSHLYSITGDVEELTFYQQSFAKGDRLFACLYVTTDYVDRALVVGQHYAAHPALREEMLAWLKQCKTLPNYGTVEKIGIMCGVPANEQGQTKEVMIPKIKESEARKEASLPSPLDNGASTTKSNKQG